MSWEDIHGDINDYSNRRDDFDALLSFYRSIQERYPGLDLNYPVWVLFPAERIMGGDWKWPDRYYLYNPEGHDKRPAALYAVGYGRGGYGQTDEVYKRMLGYIDRHNFEICGDAYEEYPLNEICIADKTNYLIRVMITVREKKQADILSRLYFDMPSHSEDDVISGRHPQDCRRYRPGPDG